LLIVISLLNIALNMGLTHGMITSIRKLCDFAKSIGAGDLREQKLNLKAKEFALLEKDMNKMAQKLSEFDVEQKTFFQNVSHELRTPLMSIQGYAEGISSHVFQEEKIEEAANIIVSESTRLGDMVENLLYVSRLDVQEHQSKKESIDLFAVIESVIESVGGLPNQKTIVWEKEGECFPVYGNEQELKRAFLNIVTNSLRYAKEKVHITGLSDQKLVQIQDDGAGIAEEDLPHIFQRFYKGAEGCSGIGLAITESILKDHHATIKASNQNGAIFEIQFAREEEAINPHCLQEQ
jgi:signal transduction histidine kinase